MPLGGWTCDELANVLGLAHGSKATQAWDPAVTKVARAMRVDALKTLEALNQAMRMLERDAQYELDFQRPLNGRKR